MRGASPWCSRVGRVHWLQRGVSGLARAPSNRREAWPCGAGPHGWLEFAHPVVDRHESKPTHLGSRVTCGQAASVSCAGIVLGEHHFTHGPRWVKVTLNLHIFNELSLNWSHSLGSLIGHRFVIFVYKLFETHAFM